MYSLYNKVHMQVTAKLLHWDTGVNGRVIKSKMINRQYLESYKIEKYSFNSNIIEPLWGESTGHR